MYPRLIKRKVKLAKYRVSVLANLFAPSAVFSAGCLLRAIFHEVILCLIVFPFFENKLRGHGVTWESCCHQGTFNLNVLLIFWPQCFRFLSGLASTGRLILKDEGISQTLRAQLECFEQRTSQPAGRFIFFCFVLFWRDSWPTETPFTVYIGLRWVKLPIREKKKQTNFIL